MKITSTFFLIFLCLNSWVFAQDFSQCSSEISNLIAKGEIGDEKIARFLNLQSELTLHKLSYALLKGEDKSSFRVEDKIKSLLASFDSSDPQIKEMKKIFDDPNNKLSRNALSMVMPLLVPILNEQSFERDERARGLYHLGESDIKLLGILAEKESRDEFGKYAHLFSKNKESDKSILNLLKIINSSIQNTKSSTENILKIFNKRLEEVNGKINSLLKSILKDHKCLEIINSCSGPKGTGDIIHENVLAEIMQAVEKVGSIDRDQFLRYGDVWLHTKRSTKVSSSQRAQRAAKPNIRPVYSGIQKDPKTQRVTIKKSEEIIHDYLIDHVLDHMPYFLNREDLESDKSLTLGLAQAIDRGVLTKEGSDRSFYYKGEAYLIPELWNKSYSGNRVKKALKRKRDDIKSFFFSDDYKMPKNNGVKERDKDKFELTWRRKKENHGQKYAFEFKGKLYNISNGELIPGTKESLLTLFKLPKEKNGKQIDFDESKMSLIASEIEKGNRSYQTQKDVYHISGVPVEMSQEIKRAKREFDIGNLNVNKSLKAQSFPKASEISVFIAQNPGGEKEIRKGYADRKSVVRKGDKLLNIITLKKLKRSDALGTVSSYKSSLGAIREPAKLEGYSTNYLLENAKAILNKEESFTVEDKAYNTRTGKARKVERRLNANSQSMIAHSEVVKLRDEINSQKNELNKVKLYHKNYLQKCDEYTVIDKKANTLSVYTNSGDTLFSKEVLLGTEIGDARTRYLNAQTRETNNETGAGIYHIGKRRVDPNNPQFEDNVLTLNTQKQNSRLVLSQISNSTPERIASLGDGKKENNRVTNGGINLHKRDMNEYMSRFANEDCPFYVLPESGDYKFALADNQLITKVDCKNCEEKYNTSSAQINPKKIKAYIVDKRYETKHTKEFLQTLVKEKSDLLPLLKITNDEYDELVKLSFGIMGVESDFGTSKLYKFKETDIGQLGVDIGKNERYTIYAPTVIPFRLRPVKSLFGDNPSNSRGPTQIKNIAEYLKGKYKNSINTGNLSTPANSAIATIFVLANKLKSLKSIETNHDSITEVNRMDFLYYLYMGSVDQIKEGGATPILNPKTAEVMAYADGIIVDTTL